MYKFLKDRINLECASKMAHSFLLQFCSRIACMKDTREIIYSDIVFTFFSGWTLFVCLICCFVVGFVCLLVVFCLFFFVLLFWFLGWGFWFVCLLGFFVDVPVSY